MQEIWLLMLDKAFVDAYKHGVLITCGDGVTRRIYPRIFTYAADYPEKSVQFYSIVDPVNRIHIGYSLRVSNTCPSAHAPAV